MITLLIPTINRADRICSIMENSEKTASVSSPIWFLLDRNDTRSLEECRKCHAPFLIVGTSYVSAINAGYRATRDDGHDFVFLGSDDIEFTKGWDVKMLKKMEDPKIGVVGAGDNWEISKTKKHGSHLLIRKSYILEYSGVVDERDVVYSSRYNHYMCDIETEQTAMKRGAFAMSTAIIPHHHWVNGEAQKDETYVLGMRHLDGDVGMYNDRRHMFEQYLFEELYHGKVVPVCNKTLSIVVASYNAPEALRDMLSSLCNNTYHEFELIIVDDCSTNPQTKEIIRNVPHLNTKRFILDKKKFTTGAWNYGVERATGDVIVVANNDITFSKNWDVYLMNAFEDPTVYIANPYQTDDGMLTPYGKHERAGGIDIRGTCYAISKESKGKLFPLPSNLVMWFSDYYLAWECQVLGKKSVFIDKAVVHAKGSKSSNEYHNTTDLLWWIIRGDALQFEKRTGIDTSHWLKIAEAQLPINSL